MRKKSKTPGGANDWGHLLTSVARHCNEGRCLIVLDEVTWMGSKDPTFLGKLKNAWDLYFKKNPKLILIVSGSNSAWIEKNLLSSTGFVGRISWRITLDELPLSDCEKFWRSHQQTVSAYEKLKVLAITGGVPRYLEELNPSISAEENIRRLCFTSEGLLVHEFNDIFSDLFESKSDQYRKIVSCLVNGPLTMSQIAHNLGRSRGGDLTDILNDLCQAGFTTPQSSWSFKEAKYSNQNQYRLSDNYVRFYLRYIQPRRDKILSGEYHELPSGWLSIMGLQFENLVVTNHRQLHRLLRISGQEISAAGPYFQKSTKTHAGCQVDYLIQTRFSTLYVCEIKFRKDPIGTEIIPEVQAKIDSLTLPKGFSVRPILIHVNGVTDELLDREFFAEIVDFGDLFLPSPA